MRQVIDKLQASGCVFQTNADARTTVGVQADTLDQIVDQVSALLRRIINVENALTDPNGAMGMIESRLKTLKE